MLCYANDAWDAKPFTVFELERKTVSGAISTNLLVARWSVEQVGAARSAERYSRC